MGLSTSLLAKLTQQTRFKVQNSLFLLPYESTVWVSPRKNLEQRQIELRSEMGQFNDFIIGDYADNYENLPLKTFSGYKYINEYCSSKGGHERQFTNFIDNLRFS